MHEQSIIDSILEKLDINNCIVKVISLVCDVDSLKKRLNEDINRGVRMADVIERSVVRIPLYQKLDTIKVNSSDKSALRQGPIRAVRHLYCTLKAL